HHFRAMVIQIGAVSSRLALPLLDASPIKPTTTGLAMPNSNSPFSGDGDSNWCRQQQAGTPLA
ncbi:hypothetical protein, partial [Aquitalea magnusonii]|uniref:hypothetical protein n=1 Tax=Aquitalea magnusonii TaxID=332411 RepID=UPI00195886E8